MHSLERCALSGGCVYILVISLVGVFNHKVLYECTHVQVYVCTYVCLQVCMYTCELARIASKKIMAPELMFLSEHVPSYQLLS